MRDQSDLEGGSHDIERLSQFPFLPPPPQDEAQRAAVEDVQADKAQGQMDTRTIALCNVPTENEAC